ncbi:MAG TPA: LysR family transcriptional regulator [Rhodocyclaceae bacterium]|nr:LysR family transcriptional regulator [Rhodocyclaceae bacterium]
MKISLDALQLLDAIDVKGSFAAAAESLHRVPSAVTHAVRKLEQDLDVALFLREGRRAQLTPAGRALLEEGRHLLKAAGALECRVQRIAKGWEADLCLAVDSTIDLGALMPLVAEFDREHGGTRLRFTHEVLGGTWDALVTGRADLAVGAQGEPPPGAGIATLAWGQCRFAFAMRPDHPLAALPEPLPAAEIARHRIVVIADTSRELLARSAGITGGQDTLTVPNLAAKLAAQVAGLGIGHLPLGTARREAAAGRLVIKEIEGGMAPSPVSLAWRHGTSGKALEWFRKKLATDEWEARLLEPL